jgi:hypothetical protein
MLTCHIFKLLEDILLKCLFKNHLNISSKCFKIDHLKNFEHDQ